MALPLTGRRAAVAVGVGVALIATGAAVWIEAPLALMFLVTDGVIAAAMAVAAAGPGLWILQALDRNGRWPVLWHAVAGTALGLGVLSLAVLILGSAGVLQRWVWIAILAGMGVLTAGAALRLSRRPRGAAPVMPWPLLLLAVPAGFIALVATVPPGVLWAEEAFGYDVLEYHLQVPREYFTAGRIGALPHNVYSYFPMNAEMLYLLAMVVRGDAIESAILAQLLNALFAGLFVAAAALAGSRHGRGAATSAALLAATTPWLLYLSGVAYVENAMLCFGMVACAAVLHFERSTAERPCRPVVTALAAGLACGCKYTALPLVAAPLLLAAMVLAPRRRMGVGVVVACGVAVMWAPWLVRNGVLAGNPVFPLGYAVFGADATLWTPALAERWSSAHGAAGAGLWSAVVQHLVRDSRLGWPLFVLAAAGLWASRRDRATGALVVMLTMQVAVWLLATHHFARFAVVLLIPLVPLAAAALAAGTPRGWRLAMGVAVAAVTVGQMTHGARMYRDALHPDGRALAIHGHTEVFYQNGDADAALASYVRQRLPATARVLMVGDARAFYMPSNVDYTVVFSRNPLAEHLADSDDGRAALGWLRRHGYTHVLVTPSEIQRLRLTYGFWNELSAELFAGLVGAGLRVEHVFRDPTGHPMVWCYAVEAE